MFFIFSVFAYAYVSGNIVEYERSVGLEPQRSSAFSQPFAIKLHENDQKIGEKANRSLNPKPLLRSHGICPCYLKVRDYEATCSWLGLSTVRT